MSGGRISRLGLACALAAGATLGSPAIAAHAASYTSTVTTGVLNQGMPAGGLTNPFGGQSVVGGTSQGGGTSGGTTGFLNQGSGSSSSGGLYGTLPAGSGGTAGSLGAGSQTTTTVTSSGGVTSGTFNTAPGSSGLLPGIGSGGTTVFPSQPQPSGSVAPQGGGQPAPAPSGSGSSQNQLQYVLGLVNGQRQLVDAQPLALDPALNTLAQERAQALSANNVISHDVPGYGYADAMETAAGVTGTLLGAEDIATGLTVDEAFWNLVTSPWHDANMVFASYNELGVGVATMPNGSVVLDLLFIEN